MGAATSPSTPLLIPQLRRDYPDVQFQADTYCHWDPKTRTVYYQEASEAVADILHEVAHALLDHVDYTQDIQLLAMERDAWHFARQDLAPRYAIVIDDDHQQEALDSYREWLHARSTCPSCSATGMQIERHNYRCLACETSWRVNEARICRLRRVRLLK